MSQACSQSHTHLNPAHASPAADEPTRNQTSEESGMQKDQHDTQSTTAFLREEVSVDTLETNSLAAQQQALLLLLAAPPRRLYPTKSCARQPHPMQR